MSRNAGEEVRTRACEGRPSLSVRLLLGVRSLFGELTAISYACTACTGYDGKDNGNGGSGNAGTACSQRSPPADAALWS